MYETLHVEYDESGASDWAPLRAHADAAHDLISRFSEWVRSEKSWARVCTFAHDSPNAWKEAIEVSKITADEPDHVLAANIFYDTARLRCGCTAFAVDDEKGPLHAHCLDWEIEAEILMRNITFFKFENARKDRDFFSVGWPGFLGVLNGVAPGRFAVTLNAVWSDEILGRGEPLAYVIRKALATLSTFDEAVAFFAQVPLSCDCLLLVTGAHQGELVVVERTSNRYAVRRPDAGLLLLTNHYCVIRSGFSAPAYVETGHEPSGRGSRERYCKSMEQLSRRLPRTVESCLSVLAESPFLQSSTIWRSALRASSGQFLVAPPPFNSPWHSPV